MEKKKQYALLPLVKNFNAEVDLPFRLVTPLFYCLLASAAVHQVSAQSQDLGRRLEKETYEGHEVVAKEVLVKFRPEAKLDRIAQAKMEIDTDVERGVGGTGLRLLRSHSKSVKSLIAELSAHPDVLYAVPNYVRRIDALPNDPGFPQLYGLQSNGGISASAAWDLTTGTKSVVVAIVDTGVDYNHPDLAANMWSAPTSFTVNIGGRMITCPQGSHGFNALTGSCDPLDDNSHGTHVAGTIGAVGNNGVGVTGVNWNVGVMALRFIGYNAGCNCFEGTDSDAIDAIEFAIQVKAILANNADVRVLNNSYGGPGFSQAFLDQINRAHASGMLFVAAAGNATPGNPERNNDVIPLYPASFNAPNVIAVAATDGASGLASFSRYGRNSVHLGAPGVSILSTTPNGNYAYFSGTSMATPHVSGAAALVLSRCTLDTQGLKAAVVAGVDPLSSLSSTTITGGRLNVYKSLLSCSATGSNPSYECYLDEANCEVISGWAADRNHLNTPVSVEIYDGATKLATVTADQPRPDVGAYLSDNGLHGFSIPTPEALQDGQPHTITVKFAGTATNLSSTPRTIACSSANYEGYLDAATCDVIAGWAADRNRLNTPVSVEIYDGATKLATVTADQPRPDVGAYLSDNGLHGFAFPTPAQLKDGLSHTVTVKFAGTSVDLFLTPRAVTCNLVQ